MPHFKIVSGDVENAVSFEQSQRQPNPNVCEPRIKKLAKIVIRFSQQTNPTHAPKMKSREEKRRDMKKNGEPKIKRAFQIHARLVGLPSRQHCQQKKKIHFENRLDFFFP